MDNVFEYLMGEFCSFNSGNSTQQRCPKGWGLLDEIGIGDDHSITQHWALYKVSQVFDSDRYVFVRTADGAITDFGWSYNPDTYARWFEEG